MAAEQRDKIERPGIVVGGKKDYYFIYAALPNLTLTLNVIRDTRYDYY